MTSRHLATTLTNQQEAIKGSDFFEAENLS